ncbi:phosphatase PAP2 family protein [Pseudoxanthomonas sp.]|uniref:phosphatase PAP2 family protein n=1 Tax=Pseudoxanthomonas sp. TaxID=1871049 RepID=UPI0026263F5D|nr:phosphatase PAP2 family protein [Pseudoxanthomonas sp.]WDS38224.1 MAG: phosphatase PAP2 family protein [Pseudoxanthomonas sp.]
MPEAAAAGTSVVGRVLRRIGWRTALLFTAILLPLWGFAELGEDVHKAESFVFDDPLLLHAKAASGPWLDQAFLGISWAGYQGIIVFDLILVVVLLARRRWREATFASVALIGSALLNLMTKQLFARARPSLWESISPQDTFSFPSGHAMGSMSLVTVLILLAWGTRWRWPVLVVAALFGLAVGAARIYLGVHYPSDILGGWAAAIAWVVGVYAAVFYGARRPWRALR